MRRQAQAHLSIFLPMLALIAPEQAQAYIGPGVGLGAVLVTVALLLGSFLLLVGFVWYPIKRLLKRSKLNRARKDPKAGE